jgi:hypothetical protein
MSEAEETRSQDTIRFNIPSVFSAGIRGIRDRSKELGKRRTFIYSFLIVAVVWGIALWFASQPSETWAEFTTSRIIMIMCITLVIVTVLSLFPAAIYAAFTWREKERARQHTLSELEHYNMLDLLEDDVNKCFETIYNVEAYRVPVPLATLAMLIGWVLFFYSEGLGTLAPLIHAGEFSKLLINTKYAHPVIFGFLGAFFFSMQMLFRRYLTADLKASVFMHVAVRIWGVMILTLVLSAVWDAVVPSGTEVYEARYVLLAVCFIVGIVPDVALDLIQKAARAGLGRLRPLAYRHIPLSKIQGLNLWHQARLSEEGIDSVQNLAMSDIIGLIVNTRLGLMRLLHWVDQAILQVHVGDDIKEFNKAGIRTATDFEFVYMGLPPDEKELEHKRESELARKVAQEERIYVPPVPPALTKTIGDGDGLAERLRNHMIAVCNDENYRRLRTLHLRKINPPEEAETKQEAC